MSLYTLFFSGRQKICTCFPLVSEQFSAIRDSNTDGPQRTMVWLNDFSRLGGCKNTTRSVESVLWVLKFDLFPPARAIYVARLSRDAAQRPWPQLPVGHRDPEGQQPTRSRPPRVHTTVLPSMFTKVFNKSPEIFNTLSSSGLRVQWLRPSGGWCKCSERSRAKQCRSVG